MNRARRNVRVACLRDAAAYRVALLALALGLLLPPANGAPTGGVDEPTLDYVFELSSDTPRHVRITLAVSAGDGDEAVFRVQPHWGGQKNLQDEIRNVRVVDANGAERPVLRRPDEPTHWRVASRPGERLLVSHELHPAAEDRLAASGNVYRPVVRDDLFHLIGETGLLWPGWIDESAPTSIRLSWRGFREAGWSVVSSLGEGDAPRTVQMPLNDFRHAMYLAGKLQLETRALRDTRVTLAVYGDDWGFRAPEFADLVERIIQVEREFFNDFSDPHYLVTLLPTGPKGAGLSLGGTGLTNCFALFCTPGIAVSAGSPMRERILQLLAHEYFHHWNGVKIGPAEPEQHGYWFSEGFTDYFAARILVGAGLTTPGQWLAATNDAIRSLWLNPNRDATAERIREAFWTDRAVGEVPYKRGHVVALLLDNEIRRRSKGEKSLDDLMRALVARASVDSKLSNDDLVRVIGEWTDAEFAARVRAVVENGEMPELPATLYGGTVRVEPREIAAFDAGFDVEATARTREVAGVREGSAAHAAGLRNGQKVEKLSVHYGDVTKPIEINVKQTDGPRQIEFMPLGAKQTAPVLVLEGALPYAAHGRSAANGTRP